VATCSINGCEGPVLARSWCGKHYQRWTKHGDPNAHTTPQRPRIGTCAVDGCDQPIHCRELCGRHRQRFYKFGDPLRTTGKVRPLDIPFDEWFWSMLTTTATGCREWTGWRDPDGYGRLRFDGKTNQAAHRVAYTLTNGSIADGLLICHRCDNRPCCNPDHLYAGTAKDNATDMITRGRSRKGRHP
jgi:hypothetical protein